MARGVIIVRVKEAHGVNKKNDVVWEPAFYEGFIRAELRGQDKSKTIAFTIDGRQPQHGEQSSTRKVLGNQISWEEELRLEVNDQSKELRLMLCREKKSSHSRSGMAVIAACGIYVEDILGAVPINKFFELFKPRTTTSAEGGMIKVSIEFEDHAARPRGNAIVISDVTPTKFTKLLQDFTTEEKSAIQGGAGSRQDSRSDETEPREFQTQLSLGPDDIVAGDPPKESRRRVSNLGDLQEERESDYQESEPEQEAAPITVSDDKPKGSKKLVKFGLFLLLVAGVGAGVLKHQKKGPFKDKEIE